MKKRSIFGKLLAIAMVFAGFSLTSCDESDNPIIDGKVWVKPEVKLVDGGAIITGSSTADINRMLGRVRQEIIQAANKGEKFTIDIQTSVLNSTAGDNTLNIVAVDGGDIVLNLPANIVTDVPLIIQKLGVTDDEAPLAPPAIPNKVEINIPSSASNIDLGINMPTSTVTLTGGTIENLAAKTALATLVIESGVTINWLKMLGGRAEVKEGGKVLGYLRDGDEAEDFDNDAWITDDGVNPLIVDYGGTIGYAPDVIDEEGNTYYTQNLKVIKGESKCAFVRVMNVGEDAKPIESLVIGDGATVSINNGRVTPGGPEPKGIDIIQGEGNKTAKVVTHLLQEYPPEEGTYYIADTNNWWMGNFHTANKEIKNVVVDLTSHPDFYVWDGTKNVSKGEVKIVYANGDIHLASINTDCDFISTTGIQGIISNNEMSKVTNCNLTCPIKGKITNGSIGNIEARNCTLTADRIYNISPNCENTTFKANNTSFETYYLSGNSSTIKNCKFVTTEENPGSSIYLPYQTPNRSSFNFIFDTCEFGKGYMFSTSFSDNKPWVDKDGKQVPKGYYWYELEDDGVTVKLDDDGNEFEKRSADEKDIPEANKANGEDQYNGYRVRINPTEDAYYKDFKADITFNSSKIDGKAITKDANFISNVGSGRNEKGEVATTTRFVIDGKAYKAVKDSDTQKWFLIDAE